MNVAVQADGTLLHSWWAEFAWATALLAITLFWSWRGLTQKNALTESQDDPSDISERGQNVQGIPRASSAFVSWPKSIVVLLACLASMAAIYFGPALRVADDINIGVLFVLGVSSLGALAVLLPQEMENDNGSLVIHVQRVVKLMSYQALMWISIASALLLSGSLRIRGIVDAQFENHVWFVFLAPMGVFLYFLASLILTNRTPQEGSEAKRFHPAFELLANNSYTFVIAAIAATIFLGGWLRPFPNVRWLNWVDFTPGILLLAMAAFCFFGPSNRQRDWLSPLIFLMAACVVLTPWFLSSARFALPGLNGAFWFLVKVKIGQSALNWRRFSLPDTRFFSLLQLCWQILIPLSVVNVFAVGVTMLLESQLGWNRWLLMVLSSTFSLIASIFLVHWRDERIRTSESLRIHSETYAA